VSLRARGDGGTGWSKAWKINFWRASCERRALASHGWREELRQSTLPNLWDNHPPFPDRRHFGATQASRNAGAESERKRFHPAPRAAGMAAGPSVDCARAGPSRSMSRWAHGKAVEVMLATAAARESWSAARFSRERTR